MGRISSTIRITIGLACLSVTILLCGQMVGLVPNRQAAVMKGRTALCETIAVHCSLLASRNDVQSMKTSLEAVLGRDADMVYAAVRRQGGPVVVEVGQRADLGRSASDADVHSTLMTVPIMAANKSWGTVEIGFRAPPQNSLRNLLNGEVFRLAVFVALASFAAYYFYLRRLLQDLDPSRVIPDRVRTTLDTLAEGLLVLDQEERIVLANQSFGMTVGQSPADLQGRRIADLPWVDRETRDHAEPYPWQQALDKGKPQIGNMLDLQTAGAMPRRFMVNSSPIMADDGGTRGALVSFDDVTVMEDKRAELQATLELLKQSRDEVHHKNLELRELAAHDPLTSCLNRRAFFEQFETHWSGSQRHHYPLSYVMMDIDHFKSVNDQYGHRVGDEVLQKIAAILRSTVRSGDIVCRYGGEEFGVLLPYLDIDEAAQAAERYRDAIRRMAFPKVALTASFGVSATSLKPSSVPDLIDQADKALYLAKQSGRDRVCRWDMLPDTPAVHETTATARVEADNEVDIAIPFHAVTALISALSYRDTGTAEHSRRVADLCVAVAGQCMSVGKAYVLETAALLHDIGKIGVPDCILLKPGALTEDEWQVMRAHARMGVEIITSAFASKELADIVTNHHAWFSGSPHNSELPTGEAIPLGARILAIADAFDAVVSDQVFRAGRTTAEAFAELRRCAGTQFDPELVERFIECVLARDKNRHTEPMSVSKQTALRIGLQIENLAAAMDQRDVPRLAVQAEHLKKTAAKYGVPHIADVARQLETLAKESGDTMQLAELTSDLLNLCRSTQTAYLENSPHGGSVVALEAGEDASAAPAGVFGS